MKRTRGLWASTLIVSALALASLVGLVTGRLSPTLGLDLEGGVSVILSAPDGTPEDVMQQALENIRNRVDAFGVGEPDIVLSGTTIEIQIPGLARGSIEERDKVQSCLVDADGTNFGCAPDDTQAQAALDELVVESRPAGACVVDRDGEQLACYGSREEAAASLAAIQVTAKDASSSASPSASPSGSTTPEPGPDLAQGEHCLTDPAGSELACYPDEAAALDAQAGLDVQVTERTYCVTDAGGAAPEADASATPAPSPSATPSASVSPSASPTPEPSAYSALDTQGAEPLPCGLSSQEQADTALDAIEVAPFTVQYCVVSSAGEDLGCYVSPEEADRRQRETGQERLLAVIGQTARLEQRNVVAIVPPDDPSYASVPLTCGTAAERATKECRFAALEDQEVVYGDESGLKYRLGPVVISGSDIKEATAVLSGGGTNQIATEWTVAFELNGEGADRFAEATTIAVSAPPPQNQIAIVVDREVISAPVVQSPITGGSGVISGGFAEQDSKDLATVLNSGALPVELTRQSVQTVSPTLGKESLQQGIAAGIAGLILVMLYLLFYYRLLGVVAWFGMMIWALLALALVSIAGAQFGFALTLAGVAGLVISLGVTADSYIVFFERLKDEVRSGRSARSAVQPAFARSYRTIVAADMVTAIAAVVLFVTAVSSVRGFAATLGVATLLDLFVVYFFKRPTVFLIARNRRLVEMRGFGLQSGIAGDQEDAEGESV